jgi:predicted RNA-binding protein with PUA-like domain
MNYFLAKTDPETYSIEDLAREGTTLWDGVKNAQALQAIRAMSAGDCVLIYHSQGEAAVRGWAYVVSDAAAEGGDPKQAAVRVRFGGMIARPVTLTEVKESGLFADFLLVRNSRLSTMAAPKEFIKWFKTRAKDFKP